MTVQEGSGLLPPPVQGDFVARTDARQGGPSPRLRERPVLSQATLNIATKVRSNPFAWRGQFSPQLVEAHLAAYAHRGDVVLDPFAGSGTVLFECARRGNAAIGAEINPAAAIMARTYQLTALSAERRGRVLQAVDAHILELDRCQDLPLFSAAGTAPDLRGPLLERLAKESPGSPTRNLMETLVVVLDYHKGPVSPARLRATWMALRSLVQSLPTATEPLRVVLADARDLPIDDGVVDLVLTSPPYINVFNYHQQYRASVEALEWHVLPLARSEIGSNRKHRGNRFLTVVQYCLDMAQVFCEMGRVCRPGARAILVVGRESNVKKTPFYNGRILRRLAVECLGLGVLLEQERVFQNRFGQDIYEDILHIELRPIDRPDWSDWARALATEVLEEAGKRAPEESLEDLRNAIERVACVDPSPLLSLEDQPASLLEGFAVGHRTGAPA